MNTSAKLRCRRRASIMGPPPRGGPGRPCRLLRALQRLQKRPPVQDGELTAELEEPSPGRVGGLDRGAQRARHIDGVGLALAGELPIQVRAVAARRIAGTRAGRVATLTSEFGEGALGHGVGGAGQVADEPNLTSHYG